MTSPAIFSSSSSLLAPLHRTAFACIPSRLCAQPIRNTKPNPRLNCSLFFVWRAQPLRDNSERGTNQLNQLDFAARSLFSPSHSPPFCSIDSSSSPRRLFHSSCLASNRNTTRVCHQLSPAFTGLTSFTSFTPPSPNTDSRHHSSPRRASSRTRFV